MQRVLSVDSASVFILKSNPPYVGVIAEGKVPTTGWTRPGLGAWFYIMPPEDGIQDFDFHAEPPTGIILPVVTPIAADTVITRDPNDYWGKGKPLVGVRIHARENSVVAKLDTKKSLDVQANLARTLQSAPYPWPWPWHVYHTAGPEPWPWPWLASHTAGDDNPVPWPWLGSHVAGGDLPFPFGVGICRDMFIGKTLRVYHTGDALTKDRRPDRANIELDPSTERIINVWFG
jgi:hypothetical protein